MEFTAPETIYNGEYTTKSDVYAFGLSVLHMATLHLPYEECEKDLSKIKNKALVKDLAIYYYLLIQSCGPQGFSLVWHREAVDFVRECIHPSPESRQESTSGLTNRPTAEELLEHPFLRQRDFVEQSAVRIRRVHAIDRVDLRLTRVRICFIMLLLRSIGLKPYS